MTRALVILDLDGTLALGDEPALEFGRAVAEAAGADPDQLRAPLERFLTGDTGTEFEGCADGYIAVTRWASGRGLDPAIISAAFLRSRAALDRGDIAVHAPEGAAERLGSMVGWHRVLVTNSPQGSAETLIDRLGLGESIDAIIGDARKPDGLEKLQDPDGCAPARVNSS